MAVKKGNKKGNGGATGRAKPLTPKISVSRRGSRRYACGGKIKK